ncbi:hypothetical protein ElyMa_001692600 [Elysia marginata]|uniref:HD domain-containing protein n=1 Tax=Elysia marginata TaxID=1093978 RepID=A0AAV4JS93_9GAST|nr:hypothetical protein ElyMa_001692600 [Elysia marginata]
MEVARCVEEDWISLMQNLDLPDSVCRDWWSVISRRYGEEWRFYHTLSHIYAMMQLYHQWRERISELNTVALAIYFHDIVYDPQANDNEAQSIILFEKFAQDSNLSHEVVSRVSHMINCTISHSIENSGDDLDLCLFLDFDLAVLGQDPTQYKAYAQNIRKEYIHVDEESYRTGRTKVIQWNPDEVNTSGPQKSVDFKQG